MGNPSLITFRHGKILADKKSTTHKDAEAVGLEESHIADSGAALQDSISQERKAVIFSQREKILSSTNFARLLN